MGYKTCKYTVGITAHIQSKNGLLSDQNLIFIYSVWLYHIHIHTYKTDFNVEETCTPDKGQNSTSLGDPFLFLFPGVFLIWTHSRPEDLGCRGKITSLCEGESNQSQQHAAGKTGLPDPTASEETVVRHFFAETFEIVNVFCFLLFPTCLIQMAILFTENMVPGRSLS